MLSCLQHTGVTERAPSNVIPAEAQRNAGISCQEKADFQLFSYVRMLHEIPACAGMTEGAASTDGKE